MKAEELRIGNYYKWYADGKYYYFKLEGRDFTNNNNKNFEPIELTEEILLKCGFIEDDFNINGGLYLLLKNTCLDGHLDYFFLKKGLNVVKLRSIRSVEIKYLHQLQNLYFALTNEELTINL